MSHVKSVNPIGTPVLNIGRDVHGRFTKNNPGGPGNPFARKVAALRKALLDSVSEQDLKDMIEILKLKARQGDMTAVRLIFQYCIGKPAQPHDPDRMDIDEWQRLQQMRVSQGQYDKTTESLPACLACHAAQHDWPCAVQQGDGPVPQAIHLIHEQLQTPAPSGKRAKASPDAAQPSPPAGQTAEADTPTQPPAPKAERPTSPKGQSKSDDRRERAAGPRGEGHSTAQPPSPNGEGELEQLRTIELLKRAFRPPQPPDQPESKPPRG